MELLIAIFIFHDEQHVLVCECSPVRPQGEHPQVSNLSGLIQRLVAGQGQLVVRPHVEVKLGLIAECAATDFGTHLSAFCLHFLGQVECVGRIAGKIGH